MRIAFAIVSLFPSGGLQRDCVDIARHVQKLDHDVTVFTSRKSSDAFAADLDLQILPAVGRSNHARHRAFSNALSRRLDSEFDLVVGFDKLSGLDVLYCSDRAVKMRAQYNPFLHLLPRYREYISLERECFAPSARTQVLLLSETQVREYQSSWSTEDDRLTVLPPTLVPTRRKPEFRADGTRQVSRKSLGLSERQWVWTSICVQPKVKGLDRVVRALRHFDNAHLLIVGLSDSARKSVGIRALAKQLGVSDRISWLGHREDIPELMAASDLLLHPARYDTTGTVLLEAIVNGLPVVTTDACGYASHVRSAAAGIVLEQPFSHEELVRALDVARDADRAALWSASGRRYGEQNELSQGKRQAAELIHAMAVDHAAMRKN